MARPDSIVGKMLSDAQRQTIASSSRMKDVPGENEPRLQPTDLPNKALVMDIRYPGRPDLNRRIVHPVDQNQTDMGRQSATTNLGVDVTREEATKLAKKIFKQEWLARKGVDVDSDSLFKDSATRDSLRRDYLGGKFANPEYFGGLEREMEDRLRRPLIEKPKKQERIL